MKTKLYVKEICCAKNVSLKDVAEKLGITPSALSQIITSDNPGVKSLERIADALDVAFTDLFIFPDFSFGEKFKEYRNKLTTDIFLKEYDPKSGDDEVECFNHALGIATTVSSLGARRLGLIDKPEENKEDENWLAYENGDAPYYADSFVLVEYVNGKPCEMVGVFSTYQKAIDAAEKDAKTFVNNINKTAEPKDEYVVKVDREAEEKAPVVSIVYKKKYREVDEDYETYEYFIFGTMQNEANMYNIWSFNEVNSKNPLSGIVETKA